MGVDLGVKNLATLSTGEVITGAKSYQRYESKFRRLQWLHRQKIIGILVFNTFICTYKAHERAPLEGVAITQWRGKNAREAASDYRRVVDELMHDWRK